MFLKNFPYREGIIETKIRENSIKMIVFIDEYIIDFQVPGVKDNTTTVFQEWKTNNDILYPDATETPK